MTSKNRFLDFIGYFYCNSCPNLIFIGQSNQQQARQNNPPLLFRTSPSKPVSHQQHDVEPEQCAVGEHQLHLPQ